MLVTHGVLVAHRYSFSIPRCRIAQYLRTFKIIPLILSSWNDLAGPVFDGVGMSGSKGRANAFYFLKLFYAYYIVFYYFSLSLFSVYRLVLWGRSLWADRVYITISLSLALPTSLNNNNNNYYYYYYDKLCILCLGFTLHWRFCIVLYTELLILYCILNMYLNINNCFNVKLL